MECGGCKFSWILKGDSDDPEKVRPLIKAERFTLMPIFPMSFFK